MLKIQHVTKQFDDTTVLYGVSLEVESGDIVCLLGPSGCGKTTLLRIVAGLETAESGTLTLNAEDITPIAVHKRGFGLMFQDFALFPHMNVQENVAFGLKAQGRSREEIQTRVAEVLALVGMAAFTERDVTELSGGEQQRVALARSLAPQPRLLMLDEPLGSLDAALRERLVVELRHIIKAAGVTALYVTHDQQEAFAIADKIAVMNAGRIEQTDTPEEIYLCPQTRFVAQFLGMRNIVPVQAVNGGTVTTALGQFAIERPSQSLLLHPAYLSLHPDGIPLTVEGRVFKGGSYQLSMRHASDISLVMHIPASAANIPQINETVTVHIADAGIIPLKDEA